MTKSNRPDMIAVEEHTDLLFQYEKEADLAAIEYFNLLQVEQEHLMRLDTVRAKLNFARRNFEVAKIKQLSHKHNIQFPSETKP